MYEKETVVKNKTGLHARPASTFVRTAAKFSSKITVKNNNSGKEANAKSIIMVLSIVAVEGTPISIIANGTDEKEAVDTLISLVEEGFGEE